MTFPLTDAEAQRCATLLAMSRVADAANLAFIRMLSRSEADMPQLMQLWPVNTEASLHAAILNRIAPPAPQPARLALRVVEGSK